MKLSGEDLLFAGLVALLLLALWVANRYSGPPMLLSEWAREEGFAIVSVRCREFAPGPFADTPRTGQNDIFQVVLRTADGVKRGAWVRCDYGSGTTPVEVMWDEPMPQPGGGTRRAQAGDTRAESSGIHASVAELAVFLVGSLISGLWKFARFCWGSLGALLGFRRA